MNRFSKYSKPTADLVLSLLADAYEDELKIDNYLDKASKEILKEIEKLYKELTKSGVIALDKKVQLRDYPHIYQKLKELEYKEQKYIMDTIWIWMQIEMEESLVRTYQNTVTQTYQIFSDYIAGSSLYNNQTTGYGLSQTKPNFFVPQVQITDTYITKNVLPIPWCQDGKVYSQRLYGHVANFQSKLNYVLEQGITNGKGMEWMTWAWRQLTNSTAYNTARLLKTETMAMWSRATRETYMSMGIEYVEIIGDAACGNICTEYVGEVIPLEEAELGDDLPPYHPNCACSYIAYEEETEKETLDEEEEIYED